MAKKKTAKRATTTSGYSPTGHIAPADGWQAVWFDYAEDRDGVDMDSVDRWPVACWATCKGGKVCGMVPGPYGLEVAELDEDFRGYIFVEGDYADPLNDFVSMWEKEHGVGEFFENDEDDEDEDDPD
jgi:hypothetical protein